VEGGYFAPWIFFTIFAAAMQSVRTAGQKSLSASITPMSATLVRYVFGLPFAFLWLLFLTRSSLLEKLQNALSSSEFVVFAMLAGVFCENRKCANGVTRDFVFCCAIVTAGLAGSCGGCGWGVDDEHAKS